MKALLLLLVIAITGCTGHHSSEELDMEKIHYAATELIALNLSNGPIEAQWWPVDIVALKPTAARKTQQGIYIQLRSFFSEESGLFFPADVGQFQSEMTNNPSFNKLSESVYSYHIKG